MKQETQILDYMLKGYSISQLDAFRKFGCWRLSGRIFDLRFKGYPIDTRMVTQGKKTFAKYSINEEYKPL